jgi:hypothetical protein
MLRFAVTLPRTAVPATARPPHARRALGPDDLQRRHRAALCALAETRARAERAERRLRCRLAELTWPAALSGLAGGIAVILGMRLAGF